MELTAQRFRWASLDRAARALLTRRQPAWVGYAVAILAVGLAVGLKAALDPLADQTITPFLIFTIAVVLACWQGWGPGLLATALSALIGHYIFVSDAGSLDTGDRADVIRTAIFVAQGIAITALGANARRGFDSRATLAEDEQAARAKAETLADQLAMLQRVTADLAAALTQQDVARVIVDGAMPAVGAEVGSLVLLDEDRRRFRTLAGAGLPKDALARGIEFPLDVETPFADACNAKHPVVLKSRADRDALYPKLTAEPSNFGEALIALPLLVDGRATGALGFSFPTVRSFSSDELSLLLLLADQCALALERARLHEAQQSEHRELSTLYDLIDGAVRAESMDEIYDQTMLAIKRALNTDRAGLLLFDDDGVLNFVASEGLSDEYRASVNGHSPWPRDAVDPRPVLVPDALADESLSALHDVIRKEGVRGLAFIPLTYRRALIGKCMLYYNQPHEFSDEELKVASIIANKTALAIRRRGAEEALRVANADLDAEVAAMTHLHYLSTRVVELGGTGDVLQEVLDGGIELSGAQRGLLQLFDEKTQTLSVAAHRGFGPTFLEAFASVDANDQTVCAMALRQRKRVIFEDTEASDVAPVIQEAGREQGFRAVQSTPLLATDGRILGMLSTYFDQPGELAARELRTIDLYARQAAALVERKRGEEALAHSELRYRSLFERNYDAVFSFDLDGRFTGFNERLEEITGYTRDELIGASYEQLVLPEILDETVAAFLRVVQGEQQMLDTMVRHKDGHLIEVNVTGVPILIDDTVEGVYGIARDVTDRKRADRAVRESERRYRELIEDLGVALYTTDADGIITHYNEAAAELWGRRPEIGVEMWCGSWKLYFPDGTPMPHDKCPMAIALKENRAVFGHEAIAERPDGTRVPFIPYPTPLHDDAGNLTGAVNVLVDITDRKKAEEALHESEERFSAFMSNLPAATWIKDWRGRYVFANSEAVRIFDVPIEELYGKTDYEVFPEETARRFGENDEAVRARGEPVRTNETLLQPDGIEHHSLVAKFPIALDPSKPRYVGGIAVDVTAQQAAENALRESEERYRTLFDSIDEGFCVIEKVEGEAGAPLDFRYVEANPAFAVHTGVSGVAGKTIRQAFPDEPEEWFTTYQTILSTGEPRRFERGLVSQGRVLDLYAWRVEDETHRRVAVTFQDITARKEAEEELRAALFRLSAQQQRTDHLISNVPGVVWEAWGQPDAANQRIDFVSNHVEEMLGYTIDEWLSTPNFWLSIVHPDDKERAAAEAAAIFGSGENGESQFRWVAKNGRVVDVSAYSAVIKDQSGTPLGMRGVTIDVSATKRAEERFASAFQASPAAISITRSSDRVLLDVNDSFCEVTGYEKEELAGRTVDDIGLWPTPAEREQFAGAIARDRRVRGMETQIRSKTGAIKDTLGSAEVINVGGEDCVLALFYDITERKRAEDRLAFLAEASARLAGSLDYITVLRELGAIAVPALADWCAVDVIEDDGAIQRLVVSHADPAKGEIARLLEQRVVRHTNDIPPEALETLSSGQTMLNPEMSEADLAASAMDARHLEIMQELGFKSAMIVPVRTRERLIGAVTMVTAAESGRTFREDDARFAEELARRAALSVENARLYTESQAIQDELRKSNEQKDEFLGIVSHELRTPVTIIYGAASLLRSRGAALDDENRQQLLIDIDHESHRLRRVVEDMMILARMELQHMNGLREPVQIQHTIDRLLREIEQRNPGQPAQSSIEGNLPPIAAEPTYLDQILRNLITNATKYAPNTPIEVQVRRNGGNEAVISVMDRGPGLRDEELEQAFERFYRSDHTTSVGGTGMGLTVCKRLVEAQSGRIWAEQRDGGGLIVSFTLPFYTDEEQ